MKYVYKIICAVIAAVVIGVIAFSPILGIRLQSDWVAIGQAQAINKGDVDMAMKYLENDGQLSEYVSETTSLYEMFFGDTGQFFTAFSSLFNLAENKAVQILVAPAIAFAISLVFTVLCALAVIIFGIFAKNNRKVIYSCIAGIASYFLMIENFAVIEEIMTSGRLSLVDITQQWYMSFFGEIVNFELLEPITVIPFLFGAVIVWTLLYNYTLTPAQKRERKLMLKEAD